MRVNTKTKVWGKAKDNMIEQVEIVEVLAISNTEGIEISRAREEVDTREQILGQR